LGKTINYPFCKFLSDKENLQEEVSALVHFLKEEKNKNGFYPDLIHAHCSLKGGILAMEIKKYMGIPYIISEHLNPFLLHHYSDFWKEKIKESFEHANTVLAVSEHQRQQILMHEFRCNPISTGNLVDDAHFTIDNDKREQEKLKGLIVTYYPNFIKDMDTFFEAMQLLKKQGIHNQFNLTIVGGGELKGELQENFYHEKIKELDLSEFVSVIPKASRTEMVNLMQSSDFLISTSIAETFGVAICEAMLCGKPVISTKNGGVNDYATEENCILIPIRDPHALRDAMLKLNQNYAKYDPQKIRNSISSKFGRVAFYERIKNIYETAIDR
jgi:glycosyltransferase involved in cell wall biosynthesis